MPCKCHRSLNMMKTQFNTVTLRPMVTNGKQRKTELNVSSKPIKVGLIIER